MELLRGSQLLYMAAMLREPNNTPKQAGAELCQAQTQVSFPAQAELNLTVEFQIWVLLEKTYTYRRHILIFN